MSKKDTEKRTAATAVAVAAAAGMFVSSAFSSPADLLQDDDAALAPAPIVEYMASGVGPDDDDDDASAAEEECEDEKLGVRARARRRILQMPLAVRAVVGVPLWCAGWGITALLSALWSAVLSPAVGAVLKWAVAALLLLGAAALTLKAVFPDLPVKKLLNKRSFVTVFIGIGVLGAVDTVLGHLVPEKAILALIVKLAGSLGVLTAAVAPVILRENKRRREAAEEEAEPEEEEPAPETMEEFRKRVLELADSVK